MSFRLYFILPLRDDIFMWCICHGIFHYTRGTERFPARKFFGEILQVSHFHLGFSPGKYNNEIIDSHGVLFEILDPALENTNKTL